MRSDICRVAAGEIRCAGDISLRQVKEALARLIIEKSAEPTGSRKRLNVAQLTLRDYKRAAEAA